MQQYDRLKTTAWFLFNIIHCDRIFSTRE